MKQIYPISYSPFFNEFSVTLKEKQNKKILTYKILFKARNKLDVYAYKNGVLTDEYINILENDPLAQRLKQTSVFQKIETVIETFEKKMKQQLQIKNVALEKKNCGNQYILSCEVVNPLFKGDFTYYSIEPLKDNSLEIVKNKKFHITFDRKNRMYVNYKNDLHGNFTHRTFAQDIVDLMVKDPSVRVRMLVN